MRYTVTQMAQLVGGAVHGDGSVVITGVASLAKASPGDITFAQGDSLKLVPKARAGAIFVPEIVADCALPQIVAKQPYLAFTKILALVERETFHLPEGIHPSAVIDPTAKLGAGVGVGPLAVIGPRCVVGAGCRIGAHVVLAADCRLGDGTIIYPNATIREGTVIGKRVIIHCGTTIGDDGFGYLRHEGQQVKVPQVGTVFIDDEAEIGSNCTIDRATMDQTVIGKRVKIDNHSHIAHNCIIGDDCILVAYARMGGGTVLGKGVTLAEDVGLTDHVTLGDGVIIAGSSKVSKDVPAGAVYWGFPAQDIRREKRERASLRRLPDLFERVRALEQKQKRPD